MGGIPEPPAAALPEADPRGLRQPALAFLAVALQAAPGLPGGHVVALQDVLLVVSGALLLGWFAVNLRSARGLLRAGLAVALVGAALNLLVMVPNGGMPVSAHTVRVLGGTDEDVHDGRLYKHHIADDDTVLAPIGDVVPVRFGPIAAAVSPGDFLLAAGIVVVGAALVRPRRKAA